MEQLLGLDSMAIDLQAWLIRARDFAIPRLLQSAGQLVAVAIVFWIARLVLHRIESFLSARTETEVDDVIARMIRRCVLLSIAFWGLWRLAEIWELPRIADVVIAAWIIGFSLPIARFASEMLEVLEDKYVAQTETRVDDTALPWINRTVWAAVVGTGVMLGLTELGVDITPMLAGAGVAGLAVSFAAKDTLSNLIAGVLLVIDRPFVLGDRIELWRAPDRQASWGDVEEVGIRAVKIRTPDNIIVIIPNSEVMNRDIINWSAHGETIRLRIPIGISYDADAAAAKALCLEAAAECEGVMERPEPVCIIRSFGDSAVNLELRVWLVGARSRRAVEDWLTDHIKTIFDREGIEIPYPKRDLYIKSMPEQARFPGVEPAATRPAIASGEEPHDEQ